MAVRDPLALLAAVVEVEHRGDRVDAQAVGVILVEPEARARGEEGAHFIAPVIEDRARPLGVVALARVGMLVEMRAVEKAEPVLVPGEMRRYPIEDHADVRLVQHVDHVHEVLRRAVAGGRREIAGGLVAPRAVERMLHDRQQLDMREAHVRHVLRELVGEVPVTQNLLGILGTAAPGAEVHLVDRPGRIERIARLALRHPLRVAPLVGEIPDHRAGARRLLGAKRVRVGLVYLVSGVAGDDVKFVHAPRPGLGQSDRPHAGVRALHRMLARIPTVEIADDGDRRRVGRPDREVRRAIDEVRAELLVKAAMRAFTEEVLVVPAEKARAVCNLGHGH